MVECIRASSQEVSLLVLDQDSRNYYDSESVLVNGQMKEVVRICSWNDDEVNIEDHANSSLELKENVIQNEESNTCKASRVVLFVLFHVWKMFQQLQASNFKRKF